MSSFVKLQFQPGIVRETTAYTNEGGWFDCDKIRFRAGLPESIGGWERYTKDPMLGVPRSLRSWATLAGSMLIGSGTNLKYYVVSGGELNDVTPLRATSTAGDTRFSATTGSEILTVTETAHGAILGDFVTYSGAAALGGDITAPMLNREHRVTKLVDASTYEIEMPVPATAGDTGDGGASTVAEYQINVGLNAPAYGDGWGAGPWSRGGWGSPSSSTIPGAQMRLWSEDLFGEDLLINPRGGGIYLWTAGGGLSTRAVNIEDLPGASEAPSMASQVMVSERDRHVLALGCDSQFDKGVRDPLLIRFSSQENLQDWDITSVTNTAGEIRLGSGSEIIGAVQTKQQIVVFTETSLHALQFIGPPYTFSSQEVGTSISVMGPNAMVAIGDAVVWMGRGEFYRYDGSTSTIPCGVKEYVFDDFSEDQGLKTFAAHNSAFSEVWWFYPGEECPDCTKYVVFNYAQDIWYYGTMGRSAWTDRGILGLPVAASPNGYLYSHETGYDDGSQNPPVPFTSFIESSVVAMGEGDSFMFASRLIPDITFRGSSASHPQATFTLSARNFPGDAFAEQSLNPVTKSATLPVEQYTNQLFVRLRGRSMSLRVESSATGTAWRLGSPRLEVRSDGRR